MAARKTIDEEGITDLSNGVSGSLKGGYISAGLILFTFLNNFFQSFAFV